MRRFLAVVGPFALTFVFCWVITVIPMPAPILLILVAISGVLMLFEIMYFQKTATKHQ